MIVFGESVVAVAAATASTNWETASAVTACLGFVSVAALWWIYFDFVDRETPLRHGVARGQTYVYGHLPLLAALTSTGVGVKLAILAGANPVLRDDARVALAGGVAVLLLSLSLILAVCEPGFDRRVLGTRLVAAAGAVLLALAGGELAPPLLAGLVAALLVADLVVEIARREQRSRTSSAEREQEAWEAAPGGRWTKIPNG